MPLTTMTIRPRRTCRKDLYDKLWSLGIKTSGSDTDMERIITKAGFGLPTIYDANYFGFLLYGKYIRLCFNYADCLAEELILLKQLKII